MSDYHNYFSIPKINSLTGKAYISLIDRYYPGPPGPDYAKLIDLHIEEANQLGKELIEAAKTALTLEKKFKIDKTICENTRLIAQQAKIEADK